MRYNVLIPVFSTIEVEVEADDTETAKELAIEKAMEEVPFVTWEVDEYAGEFKFTELD